MSSPAFGTFGDKIDVMAQTEFWAFFTSVHRRTGRRLPEGSLSLRIETIGEQFGQHMRILAA